VERHGISGDIWPTQRFLRSGLVQIRFVILARLVLLVKFAIIYPGQDVSSHPPPTIGSSHCRGSTLFNVVDGSFPLLLIILPVIGYLTAGGQIDAMTGDQQSSGLLVRASTLVTLISLAVLARSSRFREGETFDISARWQVVRKPLKVYFSSFCVGEDRTFRPEFERLSVSNRELSSLHLDHISRRLNTFTKARGF
jgi:hypothetical protein